MDEKQEKDAEAEEKLEELDPINKISSRLVVRPNITALELDVRKEYRRQPEIFYKEMTTFDAANYDEYLRRKKEFAGSVFQNMG